MAWRVAKSLEQLRKQIDDLAPGRNRSADGGIGDAAHATKTSDHNPWVKDGSMGVVTARDFTHDPANGIDAGKLADVLRTSGDKRIKYIISNRRIANPGQPWRAYTGSNPHDKHFHISVNSSKALYDDETPWTIGRLIPDVSAAPVVSYNTLRPGAKHPDVQKLKTFLMAHIGMEDGYGPLTEAAVRAFQKQNKLTVDAVVGSYTWSALDG